VMSGTATISADSRERAWYSLRIIEDDQPPVNSVISHCAAV